MSWKDPPYPIGAGRKATETGVFTFAALEEMILQIPGPITTIEWKVNPLNFNRVWSFLRDHFEAMERAQYRTPLALPQGTYPFSMPGFKLTEDPEVPRGYYRVYKSDRDDFTEHPLGR